MAERIPWEKMSKIPEKNTLSDKETSMRDGTVLDIRRLIHLTERNPVVKRPLSDYTHRLEVDCWKDEKGDTFRPIDLIELIAQKGYEKVALEFPQYDRHIQRIKSADYTYPIHVYQNWVINGAHRISKLVLMQKQGETTQDFLTVKELEEIPEGALIQKDGL